MASLLQSESFEIYDLVIIIIKIWYYSNALKCNERL